MPCLELEAVLLEIRTVVLELRRLEGDGLDGLVVASRRQQLDGLKSRLAELVSRGSGLAAA